MWNKWQEMAEQPKGISDNFEMTLSKAHFNVCSSKTPILTIKDFSQVKYVSVSPIPSHRSNATLLRIIVTCIL